MKIRNSFVSNSSSSSYIVVFPEEYDWETLQVITPLIDGQFFCNKRELIECVGEDAVDDYIEIFSKNGIDFENTITWCLFLDIDYGSDVNPHNITSSSNSIKVIDLD